MTETTLFSITLKLEGEVTILEISYIPLSAVSLYLTVPEKGTTLVVAEALIYTSNALPSMQV